ncbi:MAG TPA: flagellin [Phycisphaerae bacterium]|nr:flagellin [Phycisphaerae bacterium]
MLAIKNNLMAEGAARYLGTSYDALARSVERLSSGLRINSARDDAAGLAVRELIRADVAALQQGARNARDAISMLQTAEGGLTVVDDLLVRMRELAEQAATDSYSATQLGIMQNEFDELASEITRIATNTSFNNNNLLDGTQVGAFEIALGSGLVAGQTIKIDKQDMQATVLGVGGAVEIASGRGVSATTDTYFTGADAADAITFTFDTTQSASMIIGAGNKTLGEVVTALNQSSRSAVSGWEVATAAYNSDTGQYVLKLAHHTAGDVDFAVTDVGDPIWAAALGGDEVATAGFVNTAGADALTLGTQAAITAVESAISTKDTFRANLGYMMNRLEAAAGVIDIQAENLLAAESRVSDVDVATEMAAFTRNQVLAQAGISMLAQANSMPQMALQLLG